MAAKCWFPWVWPTAGTPCKNTHAWIGLTERWIIMAESLYAPQPNRKVHYHPPIRHWTYKSEIRSLHPDLSSFKPQARSSATPLPSLGRHMSRTAINGKHDLQKKSMGFIRVGNEALMDYQQDARCWGSAMRETVAVPLHELLALFGWI